MKEDSLNSPQPQILRSGTNWRRLRFYQKADTLYRMTFVFCKRFLPAKGDRTVDQMIQAARSGKQNIVEGIEDGKTSTEMELRLLNVARGSLQELREDYEDFLKTRNLPLWSYTHPRYDALVRFCRSHNTYADDEPFFMRWSAEEFCNTALTLCHMADRMLCRYLEYLQRIFVEQGGVKARMYAARLGYRQRRDAFLKFLKEENARLRRRLHELGDSAFLEKLGNWENLTCVPKIF